MKDDGSQCIARNSIDLLPSERPRTQRRFLGGVVILKLLTLVVTFITYKQNAHPIFHPRFARPRKLIRRRMFRVFHHVTFQNLNRPSFNRANEAIDLCGVTTLFTRPRAHAFNFFIFVIHFFISVAFQKLQTPVLQPRYVRIDFMWVTLFFIAKK